MAQKPQQVVRLSNPLALIRRTNKVPDHSFPAEARKAAITDTAHAHQPSKTIAEWISPESLSSSFPFSQPIRKIIEPPIIDKLRTTFSEHPSQSYHHIDPSDREALKLFPARWARSVIHYRPGEEIRKMDADAVPTDRFRDIYYVPPKEVPKGKPAIPPSSRTSSPKTAFQHAHRDIKRDTTPRKNPPSNEEPRNPFRWEASFTVPYRHPALRRSATPPAFTLAGHQQKVNFSTTPTQPAPTSPSSPEPMDIGHYHQLADTYIDTLVLKLEEIQEKRDDVDCEYSVRPFPPLPVLPYHSNQTWLILLLERRPVSSPSLFRLRALMS